MRPALKVLKPGPLSNYIRTSTRTEAPPSLGRTTTFSRLFQECSAFSWLNLGKQAHACMIMSGFTPTIFVSNCLMQMYVQCRALDHALHVFEKMPHRNLVSYNSLISGYARLGEMDTAWRIFDEMPLRDVVSWNSMIAGFSKNNKAEEALRLFVEMGRAGIEYDLNTFPVILKACASLEDHRVGIQVHNFVVQSGLSHDVAIGSAMVDMYAKCMLLDASIQAFYEMPDRNCVSWSAIIAGCAQNQQYVDAIKFFNEMQRIGIHVGQAAYASTFRACAGLLALGVGSQLHCHSLKNDFQRDIIVGTATLDMYAKCRSIFDARKVFDTMPDPKLQSFNALIVGYVRNNEGLEALYLFCLLLRFGLGINEISLSGALSACALVEGISEGLQIHGLTIKSTLRSSVCVLNAIVDMYGKCGALEEASSLFHEMDIRDAVSWNSIISAHEQNGDEEETLFLLSSMLRSRMVPDDFTYGSVLKVFSGRQALQHGMEVHGMIVKSGLVFDAFVGGSLVDMYCKGGMIGEAAKIHTKIQENNAISWNAMIAGFAMIKQTEDAQQLLVQMLKMRIKPDNFTYATVLDTCADLATFGLGKQIHGQIIKQELQSEAYISSTLVDMYSKCGNMQDARGVFERAVHKDFVTWNAMICGYAQHGHGEEALETYELMESLHIEPNHVTFVSVLRACAHIGLLEKALQYFNSMERKYGLEPQLEHFSCIVDLLGRSGRVSEALKLVEEMPVEADNVIWRNLLSACKLHGNVEVAEQAVASILQLEPQDTSAYILLSNIYAKAGRWGKVSDMRRQMRCHRLKKEPGCSWIEVKDELHTFLVGDKAHPSWKEIEVTLGMLIFEMKKPEYALEIDSMLDNEVEQSKLHELEVDYECCI